ncbi:DUF2732 family protein [Yokenella regensburgei]|uniref:DUF2732 family protein n=1 Tax=Yokenella regensburgei TaxID=158877 RepID=UPI00024230E9|nr:DUF2732 family protein [Yokenella regensburgei]EHM47011.1 hypothetical protein HMPREF0880_02755 [Yokenella regensburgei ATCC 43003]
MGQIRTEVNVTTTLSNYQEILKKAVNEGKTVAADLCSTRLDKLATHAVIEGLSATEIIELIREEAAVICSKGGAAWQ